MIEINCPCGAHFEVINEQVAQRARCPKCGARASDILAQAGELGTIDETGATETQAPRFQVACAHHPDQPATHNCMNCAKPLCMTCVRENGYYCSEECRAAVSSAVPSAAADTTPAGADDEKFERVMAIIFAGIKKTVFLAIVVGVGYIGYLIYEHNWGPRPRITASLEIMAEVDRFKAVTLDSTRAIVQADDELSLVNLPTQQKQWKVELRPLEEPFTLPKRSDNAPESEFYSDPSLLRDPLMLLDVKGDNAIVHSRRQLIVVNTQTGAVLWKFFQPDTSLLQVLPHEDGVLCVFSASGKNGKVTPPRVASLAFADGHELWSDANGSAYVAALPITGKRIVTATKETPKPAASTESDNQELTASGMDVNAFRGAMYAGIQRAMASGRLDVESAMESEEPKVDQPAQDFTIQFRSLETGTDAGHVSVSLKGFPQIEQVGRFTCVVSGHDLLVFENESQPLWQTTLSASPRLLAANSDLLAVAAGDRVIAFDARHGQQKWSRDNLKPSHLYVGPDGGVYATVRMSKNDFLASEAKNFRIDDICTGGATDPRAPVTFLMKLDSKNGATSWGVRNIGSDLVFAKDLVYVFDTTTEIRLLSNTGLSVTYHSIHCLSQRRGKEVWGYIQTGEVHAHAILDNKAFLVTTEGTPLGTPAHPSYSYRMCMVERK